MTPNSNNFGVGLVGASKDNLIERNNIGGNLNGVYIASAAGNIIRRNIIAGNPPVEISHTFGKVIGADIQDTSPAGTDNTFDENHCLTYAGKADPAPCPNLSELHRHHEWDNEAGLAARRANTPFQVTLKHTNIRPNRLAFPQARLVNAVFRVSGGAIPKAVGSLQRGRAGDSDTVTVTGKVVDAACYMLHVQAATAASHKDCGAACLARGVPLAIATDDGTLYFPADGNQRLKTLLNVRVRASGTMVEKHEPMELKMPVGDKNQMVVRVEGGYKQIAIQKLEKLPPAKRRPA
jgi:parallel beta-helix repeat protein